MAGCRGQSKETEVDWELTDPTIQRKREESSEDAENQRKWREATGRVFIRRLQGTL